MDPFPLKTLFKALEAEVPSPNSSKKPDFFDFKNSSIFSSFSEVNSLKLTFSISLYILASKIDSWLFA